MHEIYQKDEEKNKVGKSSNQITYVVSLTSRKVTKKIMRENSITSTMIIEDVLFIISIKFEQYNLDNINDNATKLCSICHNL